MCLPSLAANVQVQHISTSHSLPEVPLLIAQLAHGPEEAAQLLLSTSQYRLSRPAEGHQQRHIAPGQRGEGPQSVGHALRVQLPGAFWGGKGWECWGAVKI